MVPHRWWKWKQVFCFIIVLFSSDVSSVRPLQQDNGKFGALPPGRKENRPRSIS